MASALRVDADSNPVSYTHLDVYKRQAEGWFNNPEVVPDFAISMTIPAILRVPKLIVSAPGARKAAIVRRTLEEAISTNCPATILRTHPDVTLYLDQESAAELDEFVSPS